MKRLLIAGMCLVLISSQSYAWNLKLLSGIALTAVGSLVAVDGFKKVVDREWDERVITRQWEEDISNPSINIDNWGWTKVKYISWWAEPIGAVQNTGNVALKNVKIYYGFSDWNNNIIDLSYTYLDNYSYTLPVGYIDTWDGISNCGNVEPIYGAITVSYDYDPIYETYVEYGTVHKKTYKKKNEIQGYAGIAAGAGGLYLIIDSILDNTRIKKAMKKHDIEIKFAQRQNYFGLRLVKRI